MQVEGQQAGSSELVLATGARVRNAYATYLVQEDSPEKSGLILHSITILHEIVIKATAVQDGHACH